MKMVKVIFFAIALVVLMSFTKSEEQRSPLPVDPILSPRALLGVENGDKLDRKKRETAENVQVSSKTQAKPKRLSKQGVTGMKRNKKSKKEQKKRKGLKRATKKKGKGKLKNKPKKKTKKKKTKTKNKRQNNARTEKKPHEGPYGYMHPEEIDVSVHFVFNLLNISFLPIVFLHICSGLRRNTGAQTVRIP